MAYYICKFLYCDFRPSTFHLPPAESLPQASDRKPSAYKTKFDQMVMSQFGFAQDFTTLVTSMVKRFRCDGIYCTGTESKGDERFSSLESCLCLIFQMTKCQTIIDLNFGDSIAKSSQNKSQEDVNVIYYNTVFLMSSVLSPHI